MDKTPSQPLPAPLNEPEFEASLVSDVNTGPAQDDTKLIETPKAPLPRPAGRVIQPPWAGKVLGHFRLLRLIGEGGMGRVIQARDVNLHRIVALKILCKRIPGIEAQERVSQFLREARAAAQIDHPNVIRIYEINQHDGWWYIAMEMLDSGNLRDVIKASGPLSVPRACAVAADAAAALAVAHSLGIIHRDIKPANLMLTRDGRCKLTDFGLVRLDDPNDPFDFTHKAVGSPMFMAPEMILRKNQTQAIDIYSLGCTLFYALTGKPPYSGPSIQAILNKHLSAPIPDLKSLIPNCPASLATLVQRAMAKNPKDRPTAADMATALHAEAIGVQVDDSSTQLLGASGTLSATTPGTQRAKTPSGIKTILTQALHTRQVQISLACVCLILVGAIVVFLVRSRGEPGLQQGIAQLEILAQSFPNAPRTYGDRAAGASPTPNMPSTNTAPAFSWAGKVDITGLQFVASKRGTHFYRIDDPRAALIRTEDFIGYKTAAEAAADGKIQAD
jgi:eukaryotic-like serine/threonine-protein kinase